MKVVLLNIPAQILVNKGQQMPIVIDKEILNNRGVLIHVKPRSHHHQNGGHHHSSNKHHGSSKHHQNGGGGSHHKHHHNKNKHHHHRSRKDRIKAESSALFTPGMFYNQTKNFTPTPQFPKTSQIQSNFGLATEKTQTFKIKTKNFNVK